MNPIKDGKPIRRSTDLQARAKVVAWAMLDIGRGQGNMVTISIKRLQTETGQGRNTVRAGLRELLLAGWFCLVSEGRRDHQAAVYEWQGGPLSLFAGWVPPEPSNRVKVEPCLQNVDWVKKQHQLGQTGVRIKNKRRTRTKTMGAARPGGPSDHQVFIAWFVERYKTVMKVKYEFKDAADGNLVKQLLRRLKLEPLKLAAEAMFADKWAIEVTPTIGLLSSQLNKWVVGSHKHDPNRQGNQSSDKTKYERLDEAARARQRRAATAAERVPDTDASGVGDAGAAG